jgi:hypothetical protein
MMRPKQASWGIICGFTKKVFSEADDCKIQWPFKVRSSGGLP